ncbi:MAG: RagB/SusD family nutrient uptake outer membrane protein [Bacteroidota bacterium]|nr:RagB/SusD family nutrient uptake outer membrane protein [Bacteroidota bacterium]
MENKNINSMVRRYIILLAAFMLGFSGCKDFLIEKPTGSLTDKSTYTSEEDLTALTMGPYRMLPNWTAGAGDWGNNLPQTLEFPTGEAWTIEAHALYWRFQTNQVSGDLLDDFNNQWNYWFTGVRDCNFSIQMIEGMKGIASDKISKALGEIKTLRAWYYFNLVRYWGDVPMITKILENVADAQLPRESLKKIYDEVIIPDLEFAIASKLTDTKSTDGRITKFSARAILADVYLTVSGYPYQEVNATPAKEFCVSGSWTLKGYPVNNASAKGFLQKAKVQLDMLYGQYTLGTYDDLHNPAKNNLGEAIFQAQYLSGVTNNGQIQCALPLISHISMFGDENGTFIPSMGYYNSYNPADKRVQERQFFFTSDNLSTKYDPTQSPAPKFDRPYLFKFYDADAIKVTAKSGLNWTFYRYADILLQLTEVNWALKQLGDAVSDNDIIKGINEVRARALLPTYRATDITLLAIMSERAYELIFESKMLWDQRRTRMCLVDGSGAFVGIRDFIGHKATEFSFSFGPMNLISPMPATEILNNKKCLQNFGYLPKQAGQ